MPVKGGMPVDCLLKTQPQNFILTVKIKSESEENAMNKYDVTLTAHYEKTVSVYGRLDFH